LALTVIAFPMAIQAQQVKGLYLGGAFGANFYPNVETDIPPTPTTVPVSMRVDTHVGIAGVASVGWGYGNGLRAEIEGSVRSNDVDSIQFANPGGPFPGADTRGVVRTFGIMMNGFYDLSLGPVMPYVGAGIGYAWHNWDQVGQTSSAGEIARFNDYDGQFAYQGIAGLALPISAVPGLAITAEYRYFATLDATFRGRVVAPGLSQSLRTKTDNRNHSALLGMRFAFGK
jgi:opacity protein-like surface antigen